MSEVSFHVPLAGATGSRGEPEPQPRSLGARLLAGTFILSVVLGCSGTQDHPATSRAVDRASGVATPPLKVGDPLPPLQAEGWLNGAPPAPDGPGVRLLVVDVPGYWVPKSERFVPGLVRLHGKYAGKGVAFVSLTNMERDAVESYVHQHSIPWPSGYGATAKMVADLGAASGMFGPLFYEITPTLYVVGPDGRVRWADGRFRARSRDAAQWESSIDEAIEEALAKP